MTARNYYVDQNPFNLAGPPAWWLRKLWDFDNSLVVIPSRQTCVYRLAQRRPLSLPDSMTHDMLWKESDTRMLAAHGLIPVTTIIATANWSNPFMFEELRRRAPWRLGGATEVANQLDAQDARDDFDKHMKTDEHLKSLSKDAWGMYQKKIGVRSHMYIPRAKATEPKIVLASPSIRIK